MIGVVALGGYAVYRLVRAPSGAGTGLPAAAGPLPAPPPGSTVLDGDLLHMREGQWYRGRFEPPAGIDPTSVAALLQARGFGGTNDDPMIITDAPGTLWAPWSLPNPSPRTRWFYARWNRPTAPLWRPDGMVLIYTAFSPALARSRAAA